MLLAYSPDALNLDQSMPNFRPRLKTLKSYSDIINIMKWLRLFSDYCLFKNMQIVLIKFIFTYTSKLCTSQLDDKKANKADKTRNPENLRHLKTMYLFTVRPLCIPNRYSAVLHSVRVCIYDIPAFHSRLVFFRYLAVHNKSSSGIFGLGRMRWLILKIDLPGTE